MRLGLRRSTLYYKQYPVQRYRNQYSDGPIKVNEVNPQAKRRQMVAKLEWRLPLSPSTRRLTEADHSLCMLFPTQILLEIRGMKAQLFPLFGMARAVSPRKYPQSILAYRTLPRYSKYHTQTGAAAY
jgi:hypothetical protein